jgi:hypothetical protein
MGDDYYRQLSTQYAARRDHIWPASLRRIQVLPPRAPVRVTPDIAWDSPMMWLLSSPDY